MKIFSLSVWRELLCSLLFWTSRKVLPYSPPKPSEIFIDMLVARMIAAPEKAYYFYNGYSKEIKWKDNLYEIKLETFSSDSKRIKYCSIKDEKGSTISFNDEYKDKFLKVFPVITGFKEAEEEHKKELKALDQINRMMGLPSELDKKEFDLLEENHQAKEEKILSSTQRKKMEQALLDPVNIYSKKKDLFSLTS